MPGVGPILLFDKSALQSLTVDEAVWLDTFYFPCITPLFFIETLADLEKEMQKGRSPEDVVGNLAEKTPIGGAINVHHHTLSMNELLGQRFDLRHVPVVPGGSPVTTKDGRRAVVHDAPPEAAALSRWQQRDFLQVERQFAKSWRDALSGIDLDELFRQGRKFIKRLGRPKDLTAVKLMASEMVRRPGSRYVANALRALQPEHLGREVLERWKNEGCPPINEVAPYTAHVLLVDLFFCIGLGADLIGRERPTNKVDIAYLYYLPFCMAFTSRDRLHERTAPLFLDEKQVSNRATLDCAVLLRMQL
jgi:Arc/MetJ family transcription regulator